MTMTRTTARPSKARRGVALASVARSSHQVKCAALRTALAQQARTRLVTTGLALATLAPMGTLGCSELTEPPKKSLPTQPSAPAPQQVVFQQLLDDDQPEEEAPRRLLARRILIAWKGAQDAKSYVTRTQTEAKLLATTLKKQLEADPNEFAKLAQLHSDAPDASNGGLMPGFTTASTNVEENMKRVVLDTSRNAVSPIVETPQGYLLVQRLL